MKPPNFKLTHCPLLGNGVQMTGAGVVTGLKASV